MNCTMALELLLDAEPAELALAGESPLVTHLRSCARCRAVAGTLHAETTRLAVEVQGRRSAPARRGASRIRWQQVGAIAAAAGIVATLTLRTSRREVAPRDDAHPLTAPLTPDPAAPTGAGAALQSLPAGGRTNRVTTPAMRAGGASASNRAGPPPSVAGLVQVVAEPLRPAPVSGEVAAITAAPSQNAADIRGVSVVPPPGMRAMVFATRDPGITIVWLQADEPQRIPR